MDGYLEKVGAVFCFSGQVEGFRAQSGEEAGGTKENAV